MEFTDFLSFPFDEPTWSSAGTLDYSSSDIWIYQEAHRPPIAAPDERGNSTDLAATGESVVRVFLKGQRSNLVAGRLLSKKAETFSIRRALII
jgi:hypothetical protein